MRVILSPDFKTIKFCFLKQPNFDVIFSNEFGHYSSLQNIPLLTDIINRQIYLLLSESLVAPNFIEIAIPEPTLDNKKSKKTTSDKDEVVKTESDQDEYSSDEEPQDEDLSESSEGTTEEEPEFTQKQRITNRKSKQTRSKSSQKK